MSSRRAAPYVGAALLLLIGGGVAFWGIASRSHALAEVTRETQEMAIPVVSTIAPEHGTPQETLDLPGTMQAFTDAPIYARTNGYLRKWYVDIGAQVRAGQRLADIDTPEVDQQLEQARADLATADANARLAQSTAERYRDLIKTDSVSRLDLDNANGALEARLAAVASAQANLRRLEQLHAFGRIDAPFDGVITARNVDIGALIDQGGNARELFHVAAIHRLRVFVNVPQAYSRAALPGVQADLTLREFPGRHFKGTIARTAQSIDVNSRTLLTEIDVDNGKGELLPGSYCEVHLDLPTPASTLKLPVNALIFRTEGLQVAVVGPDQRIALRKVTVGRDFGTSVEAVSGVTADDRVVINPPDSLTDGATVRIAERDTHADGGAR
jgi:RND family efflux transporter MFP subunit